MKKAMLVLIAVLFCQTAFAQATGNVAKTPAESIDVKLDFINRAPNGVTLAAVAATNTNTNRDATSTIIVLSPDTPVPAVVPMTSQVVVRVKGGSVGDTYNVAMRVLKTDTGEQLEGNITLRIVAAQ